MEVKEYERNQAILVAQIEVNQQKTLADAKVVTERSRLALKIAGDYYLDAAKTYAAQVKGVIMSAREYAGQIEVQGLQVETQRLTVAVAKEGVHLQDLTAKVQIERFNQAMVEADIAKQQVEVTKAGVRAVMSAIGVQEAAVKTIDAQVQVAITEAEASVMQGQIAMIYAEAIVKQLSQARLAVETNDLGVITSIIEIHLNSMLAIWNQRVSAETSHASALGSLINRITQLQAAEIEGTTLVTKDAQSAQNVATYDNTKATSTLVSELAAYQDEAAAQAAFHSARASSARQQSAARVAAEITTNASRAATAAAKFITVSGSQTQVLSITKDV
jgi:hypothetical protein